VADMANTSGKIFREAFVKRDHFLKPHKLPSNCHRINYLHAVHQHNIMELTRVEVSLSLMRIERSPFSLLRKQKQG